MSWSLPPPIQLGEKSGGMPSPIVRRIRGGLRMRRWLELFLLISIMWVLVGLSRRVSGGPDAPWGVNGPTAHDLLGDLPPWPARVAVEPQSKLGAEAESCYNRGPTTMAAYRAQLEGYVSSFPPALQGPLLTGIERYLEKHDGEAWDSHHDVWLTDKKGETRESKAVRSWTTDGWNTTLVPDADATQWAKEVLGGSRAYTLWDSLPAGILRSDLFRYLIVLLSGGIYTDTDTHLLKPPARWTQGKADYETMAWQPEKWMTATQRARVDAGEALDDVLGPPSVIVGIEADVGEDREDWHDWYPRPLQVVQWTLASAPFHPIALQAVLRAAYATTDAAEWSRNHYKTTQRLRAELAAARAGNYASDEERAYIISSKQAELSAAEKKTALSEPRDGGPVGVMGWTGPGVWTDAVLAYLHVRAGAVWTDLRELRAPTRFADVLVLPVTGFSPGVGQFGAAEQTDGLAMVWHQFRGSWREDGGHPMLWHGP